MLIFLFAVLIYLYGSIPYAYIATYLLKKRNLAKEGTGNIGVTNAFKSGGKIVGIITLLGEISKAVIPILASSYFFEGNTRITLLFIYLSFLGTSFSIFLKGKGGKGSTVTIWSLAILSPKACLIMLIVWIIIVLFSKNNPVIKTIPLFLIPIIFYIFEKDIYFTIFCVFFSITTFINNRIKMDDYKFYKLFNNSPLSK
jgi:glycerol-3-phosphate acyltransferase PlsY